MKSKPKKLRHEQRRHCVEHRVMSEGTDCIGLPVREGDYVTVERTESDTITVRITRETS